MNVAKSILDAVKVSREASANMLEFYYNEGVISQVDAECYLDYLIKLNNDLEYKLAAIFGVCEARLQRKKGK